MSPNKKSMIIKDDHSKEKYITEEFTGHFTSE